VHDLLEADNLLIERIGRVVEIVTEFARVGFRRVAYDVGWSWVETQTQDRDLISDALGLSEGGVYPLRTECSRRDRSLVGGARL
jgi:hypothetical protein